MGLCLPVGALIGGGATVSPVSSNKKTGGRILPSNKTEMAFEIMGRGHSHHKNVQREKAVLRGGRRKGRRLLTRGGASEKRVD